MCFEPIQIIRPSLQRAPPVLEMGDAVVGCPHAVERRVESWLSMTSGFHPCSLSSVEAMERKPCPTSTSLA